MGYWAKLFCLPVLVFALCRGVVGDPKFPCYFIFGDSLLDVGNNNGLKTSAKANYLPYGIDFPQGPTGRFSNGLNAADFIDLGFEDFIPPYVTVKRKDVIKGVNYASAGSGILDETGENLGERFSFNTQILYHQEVISHIETLQGNETYTQDHLKKCLYTVQIGSNDYINNYFGPKSHDKRINVTPAQFATTLINQFCKQLNWLYKLGARKFSISVIPQIGCAPAERKLYGTEMACVKEINDAVNVFNAKQLNLIGDLRARLEDAKFVLPILDVPKIGPLQSIGSLVIGDPCCKVSTKGVTRGQCLPINVTCGQRNRYLFFDGFHPTELANLFYSRQMMLVISHLI
uniref:GDSL esterase/lipase At1g29670-like isoform X2 n=1 Tax=Erigeron canadensis TaxID=72917 RepID=UPI001CB927A8|nr:GDSL esterase/lipase At1g29670-like isoform X2 [Erigeron canadensis]